MDCENPRIACLLKRGKYVKCWFGLCFPWLAFLAVAPVAGKGTKALAPVV